MNIRDEILALPPYTHEELMTPSAYRWPGASPGAYALREAIRSIRFLHMKPERCRDCMVSIIGFDRAYPKP